MTMAIIRGELEPRVVIPQQLSTIPIAPPDPAAQAYGKMTWDLAPSVAYSPSQGITAIVDLWNPSNINRLYGVAYYFVDSQGVVVAQDYLYFDAGGVKFSAFIMHANAPEHVVTSVTFSAPGVGYRFGLRLLELEMVGTSAVVKYETSRVEVLMGGEGEVGNGSQGGLLNIIIPGMLAVTLVAASAKAVSKIQIQR